MAEAWLERQHEKLVMEKEMCACGATENSHSKLYVALMYAKTEP